MDKTNEAKSFLKSFRRRTLQWPGMQEGGDATGTPNFSHISCPYSIREGQIMPTNYIKLHRHPQIFWPSDIPEVEKIDNKIKKFVAINILLLFIVRFKDLLLSVVWGAYFVLNGIAWCMYIVYTIIHIRIYSYDLLFLILYSVTQKVLLSFITLYFNRYHSM